MAIDYSGIRDDLKIIRGLLQKFDETIVRYCDARQNSQQFGEAQAWSDIDESLQVKSETKDVLGSEIASDLDDCKSSFVDISEVYRGASFEIPIGTTLNSTPFYPIVVSMDCFRIVDTSLNSKTADGKTNSPNIALKLFDKTPQWENHKFLSAPTPFSHFNCNVSSCMGIIFPNAFAINHFAPYGSKKPNLRIARFNSRCIVIPPNVKAPHMLLHFPFDPGLCMLTSTRNELIEAYFGDKHKEDARVITKSPHQIGTPVSKSGLDIKVVTYTLESTFAVSQTTEESTLYVQIDLRGEKFPIGRILSMPISVALDDYIFDTSCWYISAISFYHASTKWKADLETLVDVYLVVIFTGLVNVDTFVTAHYIWSHFPFDPGVKLYLITPAGSTFVLYVWDPGIRFKTNSRSGDGCTYAFMSLSGSKMLSQPAMVILDAPKSGSWIDVSMKLACSWEKMRVEYVISYLMHFHSFNFDNFR